jgi:hypothetical protein
MAIAGKEMTKKKPLTLYELKAYYYWYARQDSNLRPTD